MQGNRMEEEDGLGEEIEGDPNQVQGEKRLKRRKRVKTVALGNM